MSGWLVIIEKHVVPKDDSEGHITDVSCWCEPTRDSEDEHLWVHHSADGREQPEIGFPQ